MLQTLAKQLARVGRGGLSTSSRRLMSSKALVSADMAAFEAHAGSYYDSTTVNWYIGAAVLTGIPALLQFGRDLMARDVLTHKPVEEE